MAGFCAIVLIVLPGWLAGVIGADLRSYRPTLSAEEQTELLAENFVFLGFPDIEPAPVDFQGKGDMTVIDLTTRISWIVEIVNAGGGMDSTTGNFKAPKSGTYFFGLSGMSRLTPGYRCRFTTDVRLLVGGNVVEKAEADETTNGEQETKEKFTLEATLHLKKGDVVTVEIVQDKKNCASFLDDGEIHLQVNGRLLQEEFTHDLL